MNNLPRFRGCAIFRTQVIQQKVSLKIIVFSMETRVGARLRDSDTVAAGNQWKHVEFSLPLSKLSFSLLNFNTFA